MLASFFGSGHRDDDDDDDDDVVYAREVRGLTKEALAQAKEALEESSTVISILEQDSPSRINDAYGVDAPGLRKPSNRKKRSRRPRRNNENSDSDGGGIGDEDFFGEPRQIELRCWPRYDENGKFIDFNDWGDGSTRTFYLCRYLVPSVIARCFTRVGLDCGLRLSTGGLPGWLMGTRSGRRYALFFILVILVLFFGWTSYQRGRETQAILASPCYVCSQQQQRQQQDSDAFWWTNSEAGSKAARAMKQYARYAHGTECSLDDGWVRALEQTYTTPPGNQTDTIPLPVADSRRGPWARYDRWLKGMPMVPIKAHKKKSSTDAVAAADWRHTLPRVYLLGFRGAGTTSLHRYLGAHPGVAIRRDSALLTTTTRNRNKQKLGDAGTPWDNHFFASVPDWTPDEIRAWIRRGWGPASLRDHRGKGRLRIESGPDYLWLTNTGAAEAVRRARLPEGHSPKFVVLLADPVRLVREAHSRAVDAGIETQRTSLAEVVAHELPRLAQCLWWDEAGSEEQAERLLSGLCGGSSGSPGRVGPPYLWRGFTSVYLAHWMRTVAASNTNRATQWYFVRSEDLLRQPNRTLNRLAVQFLGLEPFDFGPETRRLWHPDPVLVETMAPGTPWRQSWKSYVPRLEFLKQARKRTTDALLDAAGRAARRVVPGLDAALKTRQKLKQLHCRLAGLFDRDAPLTHQGYDCVQGGRQTSKASTTDEEAEENKKDAEAQRRAERQAEAEAALYDFFAPYQQQLMDMVEATQAAHYRQRRIDAVSENGDQESSFRNSDSDHSSETLRDFYLE